MLDAGEFGLEVGGCFGCGGSLCAFGRIGRRIHWDLADIDRKSQTEDE